MIAQNQPIPDGLPTFVVTSLENLRAGGQTIRDVIGAYRATVAEESLAVSHDQNLSAEGRDARIREIRQQAGDRAVAGLQGVRESLDADQASVRRYLQRKWPSPATGVEALLTRQAAWARMRSLLEAGMGPVALIAETTDIEALFVLHEELPTWQRAHVDRTNGRDAPSQLIDKRIAELTGDFASAALQAATEADANRAYYEPLLREAAGMIGAAVDRAASVAVAVAAEQARQRVIAGGTLPIGGDAA